MGIGQFVEPLSVEDLRCAEKEKKRFLKRKDQAPREMRGVRTRGRKVQDVKQNWNFIFRKAQMDFHEALNRYHRKGASFFKAMKSLKHYY